MTDAPLPMTIAEAIAEVEHLYISASLSPIQRRALEVLVRVARRSRSTSVSHVDTLTKLIAIREQLDETLGTLEAVISTATTGQGVGR